MRLSPEQLGAHLARGLAPTYLVYGDEPLQVRESLDAIRAAARDQGYQERQVFDAERGFDWSTLRGEAGSLSLFAAKRMLEARLPSGKPGDEGAKALRDYAQEPPADVVLLVSCGKLESSAQRSAWVKALDQAGAVIQARPLDRRRLTRWVGQRAAAKGLELSAEVAELLAERGEGNMLACAQEIDKLALLHGRGAIGLEQAVAAVFDNARYTLFALVDSALAGDPTRTVKILYGLRAEGTEPILATWALGRELRMLCTMAREIARGTALERSLADHRVWDSRKDLYRQALTRHDPAGLLLMLRALGQVDRVIKGDRVGDAWATLARLGLRLAGSGGAVAPHELHSTV
jgi:DNA polymerase-3 subunit delta